MEIPIVLVGLARPQKHLESLKDSYMLLFREQEGSRRLLIGIERYNFRVIATAIYGAQHPEEERSLHGWMFPLLTKVGVWLEQVVITELRDDQYLFMLRFSSQDERWEVLTPAVDALSMAQHAGCPIVINEDVLNTAEQAFTGVADRFVFVSSPSQIALKNAEHLASLPSDDKLPKA